MKILCPKCQKELEPTAVNVEKDTAYCENCHELFTLSDLLDNTEEYQEDAHLLSQQPPSGLKVFKGSAGTVAITNHSRLLLLFLIPFTCIWSGGSMAGIYGTQIMKGEFDLGQSLFGLPFLLGTIVLLAVIIFTLFSKIMMKLDGNGVTLDTVCFHVPTLTDEYGNVRDYEQPAPSTKRGLFAPKFIAWKDLKTIRLATNRRRRTFVNSDLDDKASTLVIPAFSTKRRDYMLALLREAAHKKGVHPRTVEDW